MFKCDKCAYECEYKYLLLKHQSRKTSCKDISDKKKFKCDYCTKTFTENRNKYTHQKKCKFNIKKDEIDILKDTIENLQNQLSEFKNNTTINNITNITNNNITNNIILNNFGNESYDHISDEFLKKCIKNVSGVKLLIEKIHFSEEAPENNNIKLKSIKNKLVEVSDNNEWKVQDTNESIEAMIKKGCRVLNKYFVNPESGLLELDINELDNRVQNFLSSIVNTKSNLYFDLRRRILALIIDQSKKNS